MFIKTAVFKRLAKAAYGGGGLLVGNTGESYVISGGYWAIKVRVEYFPKKEKAVIIELTGEFPSQGKFFRAERSGNQYEIGSEYESVRSALAWDTKVKYHVTKTMIKINESEYTIIQNKANQDVRFINSVFTDLIDNKEIDEEIETPADGPNSLDKESQMIIWKNEISSVVACMYVPNHDTEKSQYLQDYQRLLENMELQ